LRRLVAVDPVADGNDGIQIVEVHLTGYLAGTLGLNYPEFPDSCLLMQFVRGVNVSQVLTYGSNVYPKKLRHLLLAQPKALIFILNIHAHRPIRGGVEQDFVLLRRLFVCHRW
jgi:hypothetical protein